MATLDQIAQFGEAIVRWADGPGQEFLTSNYGSTSEDRLLRPEQVQSVRLQLARHLGAFALGRPGPEVVLPTMGKNTRWSVGDGSAESDNTALVLAGLMGAAVPYVWLSELRLAALEQKALPPHVVGDLGLPHNPMCWIWDRTILVPDDVREMYGLAEGAHGIANLIWSIDNGDSLLNAVLINDLNRDPQRIVVLSVFSALRGAKYPDDTSDDYEALAKMMAFIRSPYISKETRAASRGFRRQAERAHSPVDLSGEAHFVTLRHPSGEANAVEGSPGQFSVQWIVSGHFRNQWYPSTNSHQIIWIAPYWKGSEDAPVSPTVYRVAR